MLFRSFSQENAEKIVEEQNQIDKDQLVDIMLSNQAGITNEITSKINQQEIKMPTETKKKIIKDLSILTQQFGDSLDNYKKQALPLYDVSAFKYKFSFSGGEEQSEINSSTGFSQEETKASIVIVKNSKTNSYRYAYDFSYYINKNKFEYKIPFSSVEETIVNAVGKEFRDYYFISRKYSMNSKKAVNVFLNSVNTFIDYIYLRDKDKIESFKDSKYSSEKIILKNVLALINFKEQ